MNPFKRSFKWSHGSKFANPTADAYSTEVVTYKVDDHTDEHFELSVKACADDFALILHSTFNDRRSGLGPIDTMYDLGRFNKTLVNDHAVDNIKRYAQFVYDHLFGAGYGTVAGLPSYEVVDSWDEI